MMMFRVLDTVCMHAVSCAMHKIIYGQGKLRLNASIQKKRYI